MAAYGLLTMYNLTASIGTQKTGEAPSQSWTYVELSEGIDNVAEALNETVQQYFFLSDDGFARNHVTGMAPSFTLTGRRVIGDAAQDYIFGANIVWTRLDSRPSRSNGRIRRTKSGLSLAIAPSATSKSGRVLQLTTARSRLRSDLTANRLSRRDPNFQG